MMMQQQSAEAIEMDENRRTESVKTVEEVEEAEGNRNGMSGEEK
jgi:hypothetical protein